MKVLILGGAGMMGGGAAIVLHQWDEVESVVLADLNLEAAQAYAAQINSPKVTAAQVDVLDRPKLIEYVKQFDVVLNAVGPYVRFGVPVLDAIIEAGVPYVDVCDDHDAAEELLKLDEKAKAAGVSAVICLGTTPGVTNMQAKLAAEKLDDIDSLKICWAVGMPPLDKVIGTPLEEIARSGTGKELMSPAAWEHMLHVSTGDVPIWKNGKWDTMPALEYGEYVDFAEPLGRAESYYLGHAEPITLPRYIKINDFCACLGALMPLVTEELRMTARGHKDALHPPVLPQNPAWQAPAFWADRGVWAGQAAIAEGTKDGKRKRITVRVMMATQDMAAYNYSGQAIGTYMQGLGKIERKGVFGPEAALDTKTFFELYRDVFNMTTGSNLSVEELVLVQEEDLYGVPHA